jgi:hypothetical protein
LRIKGKIMKYYSRLVFILIVMICLIPLFVYALVKIWLETAVPQEFNDTFTIIFTVINGLVGGIIAIGLGTTISNRTDIPYPKSKILRRLVSFGSRVLPFQKPSTQRSFAVLYTLVYGLMGIATWVTWIRFENLTPNLIKVVAGMMLGIGIATLQSFIGSTHIHDNRNEKRSELSGESRSDRRREHRRERKNDHRSENSSVE